MGRVGKWWQRQECWRAQSGHPRDERGWGKRRPAVQAVPVTRRRPLLWALGFSAVSFRVLWLSMGGKGRDKGPSNAACSWDTHVH